MTKLSLAQLENHDNWSEAVIVFSKDSYNRDYNEIERSYKVSSDSKYFDPSMGGTSLVGDCLDGKDDGVRLDLYMKMLPEEGRRWNVEYCYIVN